MNPLRCAVCSAVLTLTPALAPAADLYVAPGGSSGASGTTTSPFDTLQSALQRARPGDNVLVRAGTYRGGGWISARGTASAPITVRSVDGPRRAILEGGGETLRLGDGAAWLVFDGFELRRAGDNVVHIDGRSNHITLRNLYAHDAGPDGDVIKVNQCESIYVESSEIARPGPRSGGGENPYQECIDFVHVNDTIVRDCYIHDGGSSLIYAKGGSREVLFERNVISEQRAGASDPMVGLGGSTAESFFEGERYEAVNVVFRNNIVFGGVAGAVAVYDAQGAYIVNNLFANNDGVIVQFRAGNAPSGGSVRVRAVNNIVLDTRGRMPDPFRLSSHTLSDFTTSNNLFWNNGSALPASSLVNLAAQPGHLAQNPMVGPLTPGDRSALIRAARPSGGPAMGSGLDVTGAPYFVTDDILRAPRDARRDRGPWSLGGSTPPLDAGAPADVPRDVSPPTDVPSSMDVGAPRDVSAPTDSPMVALEDTANPVDSALRDVSSRDVPAAPRDLGAPNDGGASTPAEPESQGCACDLSRGAKGPRPAPFALCVALSALVRRLRRAPRR